MKILSKIQKFLNLFLLSWAFLFAPLAIADSSSSASNSLEQEVQNVAKKIQSGLIKNMITIAALAGFVMCAVSAAGGNIGQMVLQNMGYVVFLVFGSTLMMKFIEFATA